MAEQSPKKKVLIAITKSNWGGAQRYVYDLARSLPHDTYDVVVAHGGKGLMAQKLREKAVRTVEISALERDVSVFKDVASFHALNQLIKKERPDILHLNSSKIGLLGTLAGRFAGVPKIIFTAHGWPFNENRSLLVRGLFYTFARLTIALSHHTIAVSGAVARAVDSSRTNKKIVVIKNGVEIVPLLDKTEARTKLLPHTSPDEFWLGIIAELHPVKGISYSIDAFRHYAAQNPRARLLILGDGDERENLTRLVQSHGLEHRVHILGFVDDAAAYMNAFDVFLLPSLSEGLSYSILEAGAAGACVIASRTGGIPEIIEDGVSGVLVPIRDTKALAAAIERVAHDGALRTKIASALYARVTSQFTLTSMLEKTRSLYDSE